MKSTPTSIRVAVLDDHAIVRRGVEAHLAQTSGVTLVAVCEHSRDLLAWLGEHRADVILLDYALGPGEIDGLNLIRLIRSRYPASRILMSSAFDSPATVALALRAGASGFFGKQQNLAELTDAIRAVAQGRLYLRADLALQVGATEPGGRPLMSLAAPTPGSAAPPAQDAPQAGLLDVKLSPREHEVLRCCLAGMSVTDISLKFSRSPKTISSQKQAAFRKLGITRDLELFSVRHLLEDE
jgi:two-component system, NarL family, captular synthesis response regulator RcsB